MDVFRKISTQKIFWNNSLEWKKKTYYWTNEIWFKKENF